MAIMVGVVLITAIVLGYLSHRTYWRYNDWWIVVDDKGIVTEVYKAGPIGG